MSLEKDVEKKALEWFNFGKIDDAIHTLHTEDIFTLEDNKKKFVFRASSKIKYK